MIKVDEAIALIKKSVEPLNTALVDTSHAAGFVVAEQVCSSISFPPFDQSAMDGYAVNTSGTENSYRVIGEIKAGDSGEFLRLKPGEACRIFTGAMLPLDANAVVKQEDVSRKGDEIIVNKASIEIGENVRYCGEQINDGDPVIDPFVELNPGAIGFLATIGIGKVRVFRKPKIAIIATGNELVPIGEKLKPGKIFESNTRTLLSALDVYGFSAKAQVVPDDYEQIKSVIKEALKENDLVLITGGISVGDYDFVGQIVSELKVEEKFHNVKQKPGKPIYFGMKGETAVFGLPGNPAAVLTSFYLYVLEALACMVGNKQGYLVQKQARLAKPYEKSAKLTFFLKGKVEDGVVTILPAQSSAMLSSFIEANCLVKLSEGIANFEAGSQVEIILLR